MPLNPARIAAMRSHPGYGLTGWPGLDSAGGWTRHAVLEELDAALDFVDDFAGRSVVDAVRIAVSMLNAIDDRTFRAAFYAALDDRIAAGEIVPMGDDD